MNNSKTAWVWVGVIVVAIVVVVGILVWALNLGQGPQQPVLGPVPAHAPAGQLVEGFPQQLILGAASLPQSVTNSYSVNYSSSTNQYTAEWASSSTVAALYAQYNSYVVKNGWTVTNRAEFPELESIYAVNGSTSINIVITPQPESAGASGNGSDVTLSYLNAAQGQ